MKHCWPFFNAQFPTAEVGTCADHVQLFKSGASSGHLPSFDSFSRESPMSSSTNLSAKDQKRLSLQVNQSRSFGKGESSSGGPTVQQKGYRTFYPGDYIYNFELPLDSHLPETIDVELGSVKYELEAVIERAGAFKANLTGSKEVTLIRAPSEGSLEQVEPIAISRNWEDQLHYDIVISGKSFPLGAQIPIAFKLTPLAKVQCHRIKVFVTENIEYFCSQKRVHRIEPTRKIQLFEKRADSPPVSTFPGSSMRIVSGGGVPYDQRAAAARGEDVSIQDTSNLLGNLNGNSSVGPTEMEFSVQLPSCQNMKDKDKMQRLHFDTTYQNIQVHHWIKVRNFIQTPFREQYFDSSSQIVMRLSRVDQNDPNRRRHFEISIDSPFHILSCRATQANTALPAYSSPENGETGTTLPECGCPGAAMRRNSPPAMMPTLSTSLNMANRSTDSLNNELSSSALLAPPEQAHLGGPMNASLQRPMHLLRAPSYAPPSFDSATEDQPPPLETPPPQYDTIASPTSGLADYFARLSDAYDGDGDSDNDNALSPRSRTRIEIPLTPGSMRVNRSMDERRTWLPLDQSMRH
jgi:arrestin-related trafficking adapter 3/6